jgi:hypothetical protein
MFKIQFYSCLLVLLLSCSQKKNDSTNSTQKRTDITHNSVIIDCNYSFEEAIKGSKAPKEIISQLKLINIQYYSTDKKIHQGQLLVNAKIADKLIILFKYMFYEKFPIAHAIPIVRYNWDDNASMQANNTYSFCYRDISFSKHAKGMAIDINPYFNPVRWKKGYENRLNKPIGAHFNPAIPGTFSRLNPVIQESKKLGFRWGHNFTVKFDDHHFEM